MYKDIAKNIEIFKIEYPKTIVPNPTTNDYDLGFIRRYNSSTQSWNILYAPLYADAAQSLAGLDPTTGGLHLAVGDFYVKFNDAEVSPPEANFKIYSRASKGATTIKSAIVQASTLGTGSNTFTISETKPRSSIVIIASWPDVDIADERAFPVLPYALDNATFQLLLS